MKLTIVCCMVVALLAATETNGICSPSVREYDHYLTNAVHYDCPDQTAMTNQECTDMCRSKMWYCRCKNVDFPCLAKVTRTTVPEIEQKCADELAKFDGPDAFEAPRCNSYENCL
ncbi:uncharacterized protein [Ptychodera flava]|uniref:uncharacterized protein n=1 Tax=Ptychodera flava TaxID=63121 RepID=UPI00396A7BA3